MGSILLGDRRYGPDPLVFLEAHSGNSHVPPAKDHILGYPVFWVRLQLSALVSVRS